MPRRERKETVKKNNSSPLGLYTIGIAALFLAGFFLLVVFGAQSYRNTVAEQNGNMHTRALLSYLATTVKGYDSRGAVSVREDPAAGKVLWLEDGDSGYAVRIYRRDGMLLEDYAADSLELRPEDAQTIGVGGIFRHVEADADVGLRTEIVDFVGADFLEQAAQVAGIRQISIIPCCMNQIKRSIILLISSMILVRQQIEKPGVLCFLLKQ